MNNNKREFCHTLWPQRKLIVPFEIVIYHLLPLNWIKVSDLVSIISHKIPHHAENIHVKIGNAQGR